MKAEIRLQTENLNENQIKEMVFALYKIGYQVYQGMDKDICWVAEEDDGFMLIKEVKYA